MISDIALFNLEGEISEEHGRGSLFLLGWWARESVVVLVTTVRASGAGLGVVSLQGATKDVSASESNGGNGAGASGKVNETWS